MNDETNEVKEVAETEKVVEQTEDSLAEEVAKEVSPSKKRGIKETKEVIEALDVLAVFFARVLADGKLNGSDFGHVVGLMTKLSTFGSALGGIKEVDDELKDLDQEELLQLGLAAYGLVKKITAAVKK